MPEGAGAGGGRDNDGFRKGAAGDRGGRPVTWASGLLLNNGRVRAMGFARRQVGAGSAAGGSAGASCDGPSASGASSGTERPAFWRASSHIRRTVS